ncbi:L,D-transpeptidase family protein [Nitratireductor sp. XY-223]|uniref:L,D-transpeptidase family protein n=1 Tax=Nitratireductor sp. XY-223 TaxID=2561926 RepID=UPI00145B52E2|nr:L,D-transpeptidase family protein [Nitratireductor sp. XY-223]
MAQTEESQSEDAPTTVEQVIRKSGIDERSGSPEWYLAMQTRLYLPQEGFESDTRRAERIALWYEERDFEPLWIRNGKATNAAKEVVFALLNAHEDGLIPSNYAADRIFPKLQKEAEDGLADFEVSLSYAVSLYGQHLRSGRVSPNDINRELVLYPEEIAADVLLQRVADAGDPMVALRGFAPGTDRYDRMKKHLMHLIVVRATGGWTAVPDGSALKPGMTDPRVPALRQRLIESKDLDDGAHQGDAYGGALVEALKQFQFRMGLETDGVVGPATLEQLNTTVDQRIRQVELNLERRRWMQADFGDPYVFVNLADQVVKYVENEKTIHAAVTQVGKPYHRTPVFSDEMEYLEFNPYWNVPYSIATKEYLPKLKANPYALASQNIHVLANGKRIDPGGVSWGSYSRDSFPFRLRQEPGPKNALGRVKFMFPNQFNIYIHDTPSKSNFDRASRYFSHGCIRVENPLRLAEVVLQAQGMSRTDIDNIINSGKRRVVRLETPLPVHVVYLTAWVNKDGSVHYRRDVYGRDEILQAALGVETVSR